MGRRPEVSHGAPLFNEDVRTAVPCDSGPARPCETVLFRVAEAGKCDRACRS